jgi:two-component system response regulator DevR
MEGYVSPSLRVFLLDDHDIVRRGLHDLLDTKRDILVVGDSGSARQAAPRILALKPDVMVLDVQLQDGSGVEVCRAVRSGDPSIKGLLLTSYEDHEALVMAILAGADGYVLKLAGSLDIVDAIRRVGAGRSLISPAQTERVTAQLLARVKAASPALSAYEQQVITHVLEGLTNRQIAERLNVAEESVGADVAALIELLTNRSSRRSPGSGLRIPGKHLRHGA